MKTSIIIGVVAFIVVLIIVFLIYWFYLRDDDSSSNGGLFPDADPLPDDKEPRPDPSPTPEPPRPSPKPADDKKIIPAYDMTKENDETDPAPKPEKDFWKKKMGPIDTKNWVHYLNYDGLCLDIDKESKANGAIVKLHECKPKNWNQKFKFVGDKYIMVRHSGKCLDVKGASRYPGTPIQQYQCNKTPAQVWKYNKDAYLFFNPNSGMCLNATEKGSTLAPCTKGLHSQIFGKYK